MKNNYHQINEHRERIGNTTFIIRSHINPAATETPEQLLLKLLESKIKNKEEQAA
ncbi:MAG: transposon-encoded TnpW family protein [Oscillospiraceae bacterium]|nr:transposon-encoded TnpW family protein [Oscillospiraceae bacterium]